MESIPPTIPFRVAQAYGLKATSRVEVKPLGGLKVTEGLAKADAFASVAQPGGAGGTKVGARAAGLVGTQVRAVELSDLGETAEFGPQGPGVVGRMGGSPLSASGSLAFYRNPADKNAAATAIDAGRRLDAIG